MSPLQGRLLIAGLLDDAALNVRDWRPFRVGVEISPLYRSTADGCSAALLRYAPGARVPPHEHTGHEHILVLQGSQQDDSGSYGRGSLLIHAPGTRHSVASATGCIVLAVWERPVRILEDNP